MDHHFTEININQDSYSSTRYEKQHLKYCNTSSFVQVASQQRYCSEDLRQDDDQHNDSRQYDERQPRLEKRHKTDVFAVDHHEEAEFNHVPGGRVVVLHEVERVRNVRVAVVTAQVVHSSLVLL